MGGGPKKLILHPGSWRVIKVRGIGESPVGMFRVGGVDDDQRWDQGG